MKWGEGNHHFPFPKDIVPEVVARFDGKEFFRSMLDTDPLTGRQISSRCWNGFHEGVGTISQQCTVYTHCRCMCHDHRRKFLDYPDDPIHRL